MSWSPEIGSSGYYNFAAQHNLLKQGGTFTESREQTPLIPITPPGTSSPHVNREFTSIPLNNLTSAGSHAEEGRSKSPTPILPLPRLVIQHKAPSPEPSPIPFEHCVLIPPRYFKPLTAAATAAAAIAAAATATNSNRIGKVFRTSTPPPSSPQVCSNTKPKLNE